MAAEGGVVAQQTQQKQQLVLPTDKTLQQATKLSLKLTKPIDFYFYVESLKGNVSIINVEIGRAHV